jgi:hypothetical protein
MAFCLTALAAQELDLSFLKGLEAKAAESTDIDLGPEQLKLIMGFADDGNSELKNIAKTIQRVQVKTFEFDKEGMYSLADMENLRQKVRTADYAPLISHKERKGFTEIMIRKGPKGANGFIVLVAEPREVTVINIVGEIDLNSLSKLSGKFGIPDMKIENKGKPGTAGKKEKEEEER